jgi:hypothetical protein
MKYQFKIGDLSTTHLFTPDVSNVTLSRKKTGSEQFGRLEISGTFKFVGDDYDLVVNLIDTFGHNELGIITYQNGVSLGLSTFNTKQIIDRPRSQYTFNITVNDEYKNLIDEGDIQWNILSVPYLTRTLSLNLTGFLEESTKAVFYHQQVGSWQSGGTIRWFTMDYLGAYFTFPIDDSYTNWTCLIANYTEIGLINPIFNPAQPTILPYLVFHGVAIFQSQKAYGSYAGTEKIPPAGSGWGYIRDDVYNGYNFPLYRRPIQASDVWTNNDRVTAIDGTYQVKIFNHTNSNAIVVPSTDIDYTRVCRTVPSVIEYIVGQIDSSILFDDTGTTLDSFYSFKTMTGDVDTQATINDDDKPFKNFLIVQLTDIIPDPDTGLQKTNPASLGELSFNDLMEWLKVYGFYWFLEERSGSYYYRLLHKTDISLLDNNPNLRNWKGYNYLPKSNVLEYEKAEYSRLINKQTGKDLELLGVDAIFRIVQEKKNMDISSSIFFIDLNDIVANGENEYDTNATDKFVLISALIDDSDYLLPRKTDSLIISGEKVFNGDLGFPKVTANLMCDLPDEKATINNVNVTLADNRLKRRAKEELTIPINGINDFDLTGFIDYNGDDAEIEDISQNADKNVGKLNIRTI